MSIASSRHSRRRTTTGWRLLWLGVLVTMLLAASCRSPQGPEKSQSISVRILPDSASVPSGTALELVAQVTGWTHDSSVRWSVVRLSDDTTSATLIAHGACAATFVAPVVTVPTVLRYAVRVTSVEDTTRSATSLLRVIGRSDSGSSSGKAITITPGAVAILTGHSQIFIAKCSGAASTARLTWTVNPALGAITPLDSLWHQVTYAAPRWLTVASTLPVSLTASAAGDTAVTELTLLRSAEDAPCFRTVIHPMLVSNCGMSGCHNPVDHIARLDFSSYDGVMQTVYPGDTAQGKLYWRVTHVHNPLRADQLVLLRDWIMGGAPNTSCPPAPETFDPTSIHYEAFVRPTLDNYCVGCHSGKNAQGCAGLDLTDFAQLQEVAQSGMLAGAIQHSPLTVHMPKWCEKLDSLTIAKLSAWIDRGAPND